VHPCTLFRRLTAPHGRFSRPLRMDFAGRSDWAVPGADRLVVGTTSWGRSWALAPSVTGLPTATAGLALWFRSGMLDIRVRSVHHARFSTRCQGRPAAPEGRVIPSTLYVRSSSGQIYHTMPNTFTARWTPVAIGQSRERARIAHEKRTIRRPAFVAPLLHPTMDRAGSGGRGGRGPGPRTRQD
jgi:hypothetical protein